MMHMGLLQTPIPCATHAKGKGGLRYGSFNPCSTLVGFCKPLGVLALPSHLQRQMLRFGMYGQCICSHETLLVKAAPCNFHWHQCIFHGDMVAIFLRFKHGMSKSFPTHLGLNQQYLMRVPLATADEKGDDGGSTTARRRSHDSSAISLPTVGSGCSEAPPSVAPRRGSTQQRCCIKRASRAGSHHREVEDGRAVSPMLWPGCA